MHFLPIFSLLRHQCFIPITVLIFQRQVWQLLYDLTPRTLLFPLPKKAGITSLTTKASREIYFVYLWICPNLICLTVYDPFANDVGILRSGGMLKHIRMMFLISTL